MGLFDWLNGIMSWIGSWIPRIQIIRATERGIKYKNGKDVIVLEPGITIYWPMFTEIEFINVTRQVLTLHNMTICLADSRVVTISALAVYRITDVYKYIVDNHDADMGMDEVINSIIRQTLIPLGFNSIQKDRSSSNMDSILTDAVREEVDVFGVEIEIVRLTDLAPTKVLTIPGLENRLNVSHIQTI